jgi:hypothetical protein
MFSSESGKNGADIRIALDVVDELRWNAEITDVVLFSGDGDFVPVADHCRARGVAIHAVGIRRHTKALWQRSCDFHFYDEIIDTARSSESVRRESTTHVEPMRLLGEAMTAVPAGQWIDPAHVEPLIRRRNWAFDVSASSVGGIDELVTAGVSAGILERSPDAPHRVRSIQRLVEASPTPIDEPSAPPDATVSSLERSSRPTVFDPRPRRARDGLVLALGTAAGALIYALGRRIERHGR